MTWRDKLPWVPRGLYEARGLAYEAFRAGCEEAEAERDSLREEVKQWKAQHEGISRCYDECREKLAAAERERDALREQNVQLAGVLDCVRIMTAWLENPAPAPPEEQVEVSEIKVSWLCKCCKRAVDEQEQLGLDGLCVVCRDPNGFCAVEMVGKQARAVEAQPPEEPVECDHEWAKYGVDEDGAWMGAYRCAKCKEPQPEQQEAGELNADVTIDVHGDAKLACPVECGKGRCDGKGDCDA